MSIPPLTLARTQSCATHSLAQLRHLAGDKTFFNMKDISVDMDDDGKISQEEADVHAWLQQAAGPDGNMTATAMYQLLVKIAKERRSKRNLAKAPPSQNISPASPPHTSPRRPLARRCWHSRCWSSSS